MLFLDEDEDLDLYLSTFNSTIHCTALCSPHTIKATTISQYFKFDGYFWISTFQYGLYKLKIHQRFWIFCILHMYIMIITLTPYQLFSLSPHFRFRNTCLVEWWNVFVWKMTISLSSRWVLITVTRAQVRWSIRRLEGHHHNHHNSYQNRFLSPRQPRHDPGWSIFKNLCIAIARLSLDWFAQEWKEWGPNTTSFRRYAHF